MTLSSHTHIPFQFLSRKEKQMFCRISQKRCARHVCPSTRTLSNHVKLSLRAWVFPLRPNLHWNVPDLLVCPSSLCVVLWPDRPGRLVRVSCWGSPGKATVGGVWAGSPSRAPTCMVFALPTPHLPAPDGPLSPLSQWVVFLGLAFLSLECTSHVS